MHLRRHGARGERGRYLGGKVPFGFVRGADGALRRMRPKVRRYGPSGARWRMLDISYRSTPCTASHERGNSGIPYGTAIRGALNERG